LINRLTIRFIFVQQHPEYTMRLFLFAILTLCLSCSARTFAETLDTSGQLLNADFEPTHTTPDVLKAWKTSGKVTTESQQDQHWLQLCDANSRAQMDLKLDPAYEQLTITCRFKTTDVVKGKEGWQDARMALRFVDDKYKRVGDWPAIKIRGRETHDWQTITQTLDIPKDAAYLVIEPGISGCCSFDDINIKQHHKPQANAQPSDMLPPAACTNLWQNDTAYTEQSQTQSRICLNDLWQFMPALKGDSDIPPATGSGWGYFKVPGIWPPANRAQSFFFRLEPNRKFNPATSSSMI
jgi:hypothetical protein